MCVNNFEPTRLAVLLLVLCGVFLKKETGWFLKSQFPEFILAFRGFNSGIQPVNFKRLHVLLEY